MGVHVTQAAWECNVLYGAVGVSNTILLVLVRPACTGQRCRPVPGDMDHPPGCMNARSHTAYLTYI